MIVFLTTLMLAGAQNTPSVAVSVCDIANGLVREDTEVEVTGRYVSDFMHFAMLSDEGCHVSLHGEFPDGPASEEFLNATWRRAPFPDLDQTHVTLRIRGAAGQFNVYMTEGLRPGIRISELVEVSVREGAGQ